MGELGALGKVAVVAAIISLAYFLYVRRAFGRTGATALALLVFFLLVVLLGDVFCGGQA